MNPKLIGLAGPLEGAFYALTDGQEVLIGRDPANLLWIDDPSLAASHCLIRGLGGGQFRIWDLDTGRGTFLNGIPVRNQLLRSGDQIRIGHSLLLFFVDEEELAEASGDPVRYRTEVKIEHAMVGESPRMRQVYQFIAKVAPRDSTVLISGESGTGKELAARAIHGNSRRAGKPFVAINCAALTEQLIESELFGHEKGSFTGAIALKRGKLEVANGGTVFLDEISELNLGLQAKLLRVLQEREFDRVGGTSPVKVDVRLIAATNRDLEQAVGAGRFRQDLYYRLNVVSVRMPPLRERREDIPLLANYFVAKYNLEAHRQVTGLSPEARSALLNYDWPGNVRELENAMQRAIVLGSTDVILPEDLPESLLEAEPAAGAPDASYHESIRQTKKLLIMKAVDQAVGNYTNAARQLGVHPNYLHRLIRNLNLKPALRVAGR